MTGSEPLKLPAVTAEVWRGGLRESAHQVYAAATDGSGNLIAAVGDADYSTTLRSAAKPLQAVPLTLLSGAAALGLSDDELAICCASHPGSPRHAALVASVLALSGFVPDDLVCGPAGFGENSSPLRHGCSGNHAALITAAHLLGAPLHGYERQDHPVQLLILRQIAEMAGVLDVSTAVDGCGIPTFGLRIREMARAFAQLVRQDAAWERIPRVMAAYPELIGSEDWIDVRLMQATGGRLIAKTGAEGLLCIADRDAERGMAVKVLDGTTRPLGLATIHLLARLGWITADEAAHPFLAAHAAPVIALRTGEVVGQVKLACDSTA